MDRIHTNRFLLTMTLLIIVVPVVIEADIDILSPISPRPPHSPSTTSHVDMVAEPPPFTYLKDEEVCIDYCDKSCWDIENSKEHIICVTICIAINCERQIYGEWLANSRQNYKRKYVHGIKMHNIPLSEIRKPLKNSLHYL